VHRTKQQVILGYPLLFDFSRTSTSTTEVEPTIGRAESDWELNPQRLIIPEKAHQTHRHRNSHLCFSPDIVDDNFLQNKIRAQP